MARVAGGGARVAAAAVAGLHWTEAFVSQVAAYSLCRVCLMLRAAQCGGRDGGGSGVGFGVGRDGG